MKRLETEFYNKLSAIDCHTAVIWLQPILHVNIHGSQLLMKWK